MILQIFAIFDSKAKAYAPPFYSQNTDTAVRPIQHVANDVEHSIGRSPADYTLFHLGEFDDSDCSITTVTKSVVCNCIELVRPDEQPELFSKDAKQLNGIMQDAADPSDEHVE